MAGRLQTGPSRGSVGREGLLVLLAFALDVGIGALTASRSDLHQEFILPWYWDRPVFEDKRSPDFFEDECFLAHFGYQAVSVMSGAD